MREQDVFISQVDEVNSPGHQITRQETSQEIQIASIGGSTVWRSSQSNVRKLD